MDPQRVFSPEALRPHLSMGLPLYRPESSYVRQDKLRPASRSDKRRESVEFSESRTPAVLDYCDNRCRSTATECYDCSRRNGTPAARRGRKAADLPAMGRLPGYRTGSLSRNRHWSLRHCFIRWKSCSDGHSRPHRREPPYARLRRRCDWIEGGGGNKRTRLGCSAGEWGAALAAPLFLRMPAKPYASVTIAMGTRHCDAVATLEGVRILASHAPTLPMSNCSTPEQCRCRFKKYTDRRDDEEGRRSSIGAERASWYAGGQRRKSRGRRPKD